MSVVLVRCANCGGKKEKTISHYNRATKLGASLYCSSECYTDSKRLFRTDEQKKQIKAEYDREYRKKNRLRLKEKKAAYHRKTYTYEKGVEFRERFKNRVASYKKKYYAQPENKEHKRKYDRARRCKIKFGDFWEAGSILIDLENELRGRISKGEKIVARGRSQKNSQRRRYHGIKRGYA